jgi:hypothetical protein
MMGLRPAVNFALATGKASFAPFVPRVGPLLREVTEITPTGAGAG